MFIVEEAQNLSRESIWRPPTRGGGEWFAKGPFLTPREIINILNNVYYSSGNIDSNSIFRLERNIGVSWQRMFKMLAGKKLETSKEGRRRVIYAQNAGRESILGRRFSKR